MCKQRSVLALFFVVQLSGGCAPTDDPEIDASTDAGGGVDAAPESGAGDAQMQASCETDSACDDGRFCNGLEICDPDADGADANGCLPGTNPCEGMDCNEDTDECAVCVRGGPSDVDNDGFCLRSVSTRMGQGS